MEQFTVFSEEDTRLLDKLVYAKQQHYGSHEDILREGEYSPTNHLLSRASHAVISC